MGPRFEAGYILGVALGVIDEAGVGGIAERAQHAGHILQRAFFGAAIGERPGWFTFKIEDYEIGLHAQHLAQVIVTMNSNSLRSKAGRFQYCEMIEDAAAAAEHCGGNFDHFVGQVGYAFFQHVQDLRSVLLKIGEDGLEIVGRPRLGLERRIICWRSQRQM